MYTCNSLISIEMVHDTLVTIPWNRQLHVWGSFDGDLFIGKMNKTDQGDLTCYENMNIYIHIKKNHKTNLWDGCECNAV